MPVGVSRRMLGLRWAQDHVSLPQPAASPCVKEKK